MQTTAVIDRTCIRVFVAFGEVSRKQKINLSLAFSIIHPNAEPVNERKIFFIEEKEFLVILRFCLAKSLAKGEAREQDV